MPAGTCWEPVEKPRDEKSSEVLHQKVSGCAGVI
jgi:hypothetical protein